MVIWPVKFVRVLYYFFDILFVIQWPLYRVPSLCGGESSGDKCVFYHIFIKI